MKINIHLVSPLIHYTPLYLAIERLYKNRVSIDYTYVEAESDRKMLEIFAFSKELPGTINLFLTSITDIKDRLINDLKYDDKKVQGFYKRSVLWAMLIDRTPISIIGKQDSSSQAFDTHIENYKKGGRLKKIAGYAEGSTVNWFIDKSFNHQKAFEIQAVDFGSDEEFKMLKNGEVDYAVTLEPWKSQQYGLKIIYDIPIAPFGFTGILSLQDTFIDPDKRIVMEQFQKQLMIEIARLYRAFEPKLYNWELFSDWNIKENRNRKLEQRAYERDQSLVIIKSLIGEKMTDEEINNALEWMSSKRIWAIDPISPLEGTSDNINSANEFIFDLVKKEEQRRESDKARQELGVHIIHHLKNEIMNKISYPLANIYQSLKDEETKKFVYKVKKYSEGLSDKYKIWLNTLNLKYENEDRIFYCPYYFVRKTFDKFKDNEEYKYITFGINAEVEAEELLINIPEIVIENTLDEMINNAHLAFQSYYADKIDSEKPKMEVNMGWRNIKINDQPLVEFSISNSNTYIMSSELEWLGKNPIKSGTGSSGFGLYFMNGMLKLFNAFEIDPDNQRYFLPKVFEENNKDFVCFSFYFHIVKNR